MITITQRQTATIQRLRYSDEQKLSKYIIYYPWILKKKKTLEDLKAAIETLSNNKLKTEAVKI